MHVHLDPYDHLCDKIRGVCVPKEEEGEREVGGEGGCPLSPASSQRTARLWDWDLALSC